MLRKSLIIAVLSTSLTSTALAQTTAWADLQKHYRAGLELLEQGKFAAASGQFDLVGRDEALSAVNAEAIPEIGLIREGAEFYNALCALELGNDNAESLFLKFIARNQSSNFTKLAYYQVGRSYFAQKNYAKTIEWFSKLDQNSLSGRESDEYRFKLAYAYFETGDNQNAEPLFGQLKEERGIYQEQSIYYFAYINYLNKNYKAALAEFEKLKGSKAYENSYPYYISALYFLDKRYDDVLNYAIPILNTTQQQYDTEMFRIVGASYFAKSDYPRASEYFGKFQAKDQGKTQNDQDNYQIGYTAYKLKDYPKAITELEKLAETNEYMQSGMIALGESFLRTGNKQSARNAFFKASRLNYDAQLQEEGLFNYAKLSYELDFHQVALDATQQFIKNYPRSARQNEAKTLLGQVLLSTRNYKDAVDVLESIPNRNRDAQLVYQKVTYYRGLEFYNERAFQNGISMFMRSNANAVDQDLHALSTYWLAEAMYEVRKFGESVENFEKFLSMPGARKTDVFNFANYALAYAAFEHENYRKSATYFTRFLQGNERDQNTINDAILRLADSYFVLKDYSNALVYYNRIIASGVSGEDYALFQRGMIQGLQGQNETKIATHQSLLQQFPNSNYADDAGFEIAYTYFIIGNHEVAKTDLNALILKYPNSSYVPRALVTIGLVQLNEGQDDAAIETFKRVIDEYSTTDEAKLALESVKNIYLERADASGFLAYANTTNIGNLSTAEQDNITFQAAYNLFVKGDAQATYEAINAYFDKFPKPIHDKHARFIRAESLVKLGRSAESIPDYEYILNDWTSDYTERALMSISRLYLREKKYNEAIVHLKKLELTSEYRAHYSFAVNNLMEAYSNINQPDEVIKYAELIRVYERSSEEDKLRADLYTAKANLQIGDQAEAMKFFENVASKSQTVTGAEAKYNVAAIQYQRGDYKASLATAFDLTNKMSSHDYWVAKAFILIADNYVAQKDTFQAKSTLQSIIDNYEVTTDDILSTAKEKLTILNQ